MKIINMGRGVLVLGIHTYELKTILGQFLGGRAVHSYQYPISVVISVGTKIAMFSC